jgi:hypothetical protein
MIAVSLFASAVRPKMWTQYLNSLKNTSVEYEVVFAGNSTHEEVEPFTDAYPEFKYIYTKNIKPSQCYELARRQCVGETIHWSCDDAEYINDVLGKAYAFWKSKNDDKLILSIQTMEHYADNRGGLYNMQTHRFFGGDGRTPLMAPLALMSRKFLDDLGGYDHRYVSGQAENDIVMRAYERGGACEVFGNDKYYIDIDHYGKSISTGESVDKESFLKRPFATGYDTDRKVLEASWSIAHEDRLMRFLRMGIGPTQGDWKDFQMNQIDIPELYGKEISLVKSESNHGHWD